ncbi:NAD-dependent epimerase/dehydratase family protein [Actinosynnema sp. NPDC047251]|uniref:NAD-dependent epimerase/dehydratase n=1 Tax=Saccharothrix espanaensis (strain ATCC 51144 / DSM 44229 / JCM 9112 / NBRC 15066 / NRRL 15764) TaxID=1179773 RepID=K0JW62_SACES|nr:NAD-dependent epimerase/dehydratase family protein [Saccharothrix espanaensis]CCH30271.1 NAD-dependent epimerase/dehydratase [Saccharothrix espanaensis DSM 44229]
MTVRRVLLFGASGYLGREVAGALSSDPGGAAVVRVGRRAPDAVGWARHDLVTGGAGDLADLLSTTAPDVVVNCVGLLDGTYAEMVAANVTATARLLDAIPAAAPSARLVVLGSAAEYGVVPEGVAVTEDTPANPVAAYGITKLAGTTLVRAAVTAGKLDAVVLRVFNPIGAGLPDGTVLGRAASAVRSALGAPGQEVRLGPLGAYRDFVDVRDVAEAVSRAAFSATRPDPVLNVGSGVAVPVRDAVGLLAEFAGYTGRIVESDPAPARSGAVNWIAADLTRARRSLDWSPRRDLRASVRDLWAAVG